MSAEAQEQIMNAAALLVEAHEREAFYAGLQVGVQLLRELRGDSKAKQGD